MIRHIPRLTDVLVIAALLIIALLKISAGDAGSVPSPTHLMVYKLCLVYVAGYCGYLLDVSLFPYARPHGYLLHDWRKKAESFYPFTADHPIAPGYHLVFAISMLRRAIIIYGFIEGVTRGL